MTGFLPGWLAAAALAICTGKIVGVISEKQPVPHWLLAAASVLAAGTIPQPTGAWSVASASREGRPRCPLLYSLLRQVPP
jgi:hypothetical protein